MSSLSEGYARVDREDRQRELAAAREREGYAEQQALRVLRTLRKHQERLLRLTAGDDPFDEG